MDQVNDEKVITPGWLDEQFIEGVLRDYEKDNKIVLKSLQITAGAQKGDHLSSIIFRAVAKYSSGLKCTQSKSMIIKTIPEEDGFKKDILQKSNLFQTEIGIYSKTLPKFENVLRNYGDSSKLCSKIIYHSLTPRKVIIFEDLVALGYDCIRDRYLHDEELKMCLSKIAKWHAVSFKLASEGDESIKNYHDGLVSRPKEEQPEFERDGLNNLIEAISNIEELKIYSDKLKKLEPFLIPKCNELFNAHIRGHKSIMVLNHGDLHGRNVMFKLNSQGKVEDVMLIDMQISCFGPSVIDLFCSIYMLFDFNQRKNQRDEMIKYYFSNFLSTLRKIEFIGDMPTLEQFYEDMKTYQEFELWLTATLLPIIYSVMSQNGEVPSEDLVSTKEAQMQMYLNPNFIKEIKWMLPKYFKGSKNQ